MVRLRGFASLAELASELSVSESTVRRDLDHLEETGTAKRTHGGVFYTGPSPQLPHFQPRQRSSWELKKAIARRAAELIEEGDTVLLDGGSTTYELARLLLDAPFRWSRIPSGCQPFHLQQHGGRGIDWWLRPFEFGGLGGPHAREMVRSLHYDGCSERRGDQPRGYFNSMC